MKRTGERHSSDTGRDVTDFSITSERLAGHSNGVVNRVTGELDMRTTPNFREDFTAAVGPNATHVLVDLQGVTFIDSHNLGTFVGAWQKIRSRGGWIGLVSAAPYVTRVFQVTNLDKLFRFFDSEQAYMQCLADESKQPQK